MVNVGKLMYERRYIIAGDGNLSVRLDENTILATPTALCKGLLTPDQIVKMDLAGNVLDGEYHPSSEIKMHLAAYNTRPDIWAVVHAHPPISTGFAVAGIPLDQLILAEMVVNFGSIPLAPYFSPSTSELAESVAEQVRCHDAVLMANHGVMTIGPDLYATYHRLEMVEQFATISLVAHLLGSMKTFSAEQLRDLRVIREKSGIDAQNPHHAQCPFPGEATSSEHYQAPSSSTEKNAPPNLPDMDVLVNIITQTVISRLR
jgi:L-fuculose-phosphate aldolase